MMGTLDAPQCTLISLLPFESGAPPQLFLINQVRQVGSGRRLVSATSSADPWVTHVGAFLLSCLLFLPSFHSMYVYYLHADSVLKRARERVLVQRQIVDSRGLPGVNWGVMWFVLLALLAALPSPLSQIPCDYSLMASLMSVCFKQPATAQVKMIRLTLQWHYIKWITI